MLIEKERWRGMGVWNWNFLNVIGRGGINIWHDVCFQSMIEGTKEIIIAFFGT
jgi:hypothetical protein